MRTMMKISVKKCLGCPVCGYEKQDRKDADVNDCTKCILWKKKGCLSCVEKIPQDCALNPLVNLDDQVKCILCKEKECCRRKVLDQEGAFFS
jgi:hypothetical protein